MKSVALVGGFASGKTTVADGLVAEHGYRKVSLATTLKRIAADAIGNGEEIQKTDLYEVTNLKGFERYLSGRQVLQELGQSVKALDRNFWTRWLLSDIANGNYGPGPFVVDDCRFSYEAHALAEKGFLVVRIAVPDDERRARYASIYGREPSAAEMAHPSEVEMAAIEEDMLVDGTMSTTEVLGSVAEYLRA